MRSDRNWTFATIVATRDIAEGIREFQLKPDSGGQRFPSGAHLAVRVLIEGKVALRYYSLVGEAPMDGCWRIAVKREMHGRGGSAYMWSLPVGGRLEVAEPDTHFELTRATSEALLIAGGIGITPILGMALRLQRTGRKFRLLYAGRSRAGMAYLDELQQALGDKLALFVDDEGSKLDLARSFAELTAEAEVYICGPIGLMEAARAAWSASGRRHDRYICETFGSSGRFMSQPFTVRIAGLDAAIEVAANQSMLDALEDAGIGVVSDCRRGECGLCAVNVVTHRGEIDHRDVFFSDHQHALGQKICTCVSRMAGGEITIDPLWSGDQVLKSGPELKEPADT